MAATDAAAATGSLDTAPDLGAVAAEAARLVAAVRDDQLAGPTPCAALSVAGLLDHLLGVAEAFTAVAEGRPVEQAPMASAEHLPAGWRPLLAGRLPRLAAAWAEPGAWEGTADLAGLRLPAPAAGLVALTEVLVHGWDLAAACGQVYRPDPAATQLCLAFAVDLEASAPEVRNGTYGPRVPVSGDAHPFQRLLGQTGRDPAWAAP